MWFLFFSLIATHTPPNPCASAVSKLTLEKIAGAREWYDEQPKSFNDASFWQLLASQNIPFTPEVMEAAKVPVDLAKHLLPDGSFEFQPSEKFQLSAENGDFDFASLRIGRSSRSLESATTSEPWLELAVLVHGQPDLKLKVIVGPEYGSKGLSAKIRDQIVHINQIDPQIQFYPAEEFVTSYPTDEGKALMDGRRLVGRFRTQNVGLPTIAMQNSIQSVRQNGIEKTVSSFFEIEGGDIVVGHDKIFIGRTTLENNAYVFALSPSQVLRAMTAEWNKNVGVFDTSHSLFKKYAGHLDLLLSIVRNQKSGREALLLSSPRAALKAIDEFSGTDARAEILKSRYLKEHSKELELWSSWLDQFRLIAKQYGFEMIEVPMLAFPAAQGRGMELMINYVNTWVGGKRGLLLQSGVLPLDQAAEKIYRDLGYEMFPIRYANQSLCALGGIRCTIAMSWK